MVSTALLAATAFNEGEQLLAGPWSMNLAVKIALNVLTPLY